uniref:Uncharacterized protein n=3 Tax=Avena sativa TaxID=4498 RepID=A0ACD5YU90_AVESA
MAGATSSAAPALVICFLSLVLFLHRCRICGSVEMERTLAMIKPDGLSGNYTKEIKEAILESGFDIIEEAVFLLDAERASLFYAEHATRSFFDSLVKYMTSGPVHAMVLERHDAIAHWRALIGPTDARKAKTSHPNRFKNYSHLFSAENTLSEINGNSSANILITTSSVPWETYCTFSSPKCL